jgi:hypothetical protein
MGWNMAAHVGAVGCMGCAAVFLGGQAGAEEGKRKNAKQKNIRKTSHTFFSIRLDSAQGFEVTRGGEFLGCSATVDLSQLKISFSKWPLPFV